MNASNLFVSQATKGNWETFTNNEPEDRQDPVDHAATADWESVARALSEYYPGTVSDDFTDRVTAANSMAALTALLGQSPATLSTYPVNQAAPGGPAPAAAPGGTQVQAYWWGFQVYLSHNDLTWVLDSADMVNNAVVAIGGSIPSPAQPWIILIGPFVALTHQALRELDAGSGIYISMSWFAPGLFVPTRA